jgi:Zn-dependent membrane protease YugP
MRCKFLKFNQKSLDFQKNSDINNDMRYKFLKFKENVKATIVTGSIFTGVLAIIGVVLLAILTPLIIAGGVFFLVWHIINKIW